MDPNDRNVPLGGTPRTRPLQAVQPSRSLQQGPQGGQGPRPLQVGQVNAIRTALMTPHAPIVLPGTHPTPRWSAPTQMYQQRQMMMSAAVQNYGYPLPQQQYLQPIALAPGSQGQLIRSSEMFSGQQMTYMTLPGGPQAAPAAPTVVPMPHTIQHAVQHHQQPQATPVGANILPPLLAAPGSNMSTPPAPQPGANTLTPPGAQPGANILTPPLAAPGSNMSTLPAPQPGANTLTPPGAQPGANILTPPAAQPGANILPLRAAQPGANILPPPVAQPGEDTVPPPSGTFFSPPGPPPSNLSARAAGEPVMVTTQQQRLPKPSHPGASRSSVPAGNAPSLRTYAHPSTVEGDEAPLLQVAAEQHEYSAQAAGTSTPSSSSVVQIQRKSSKQDEEETKLLSACADVKPKARCGILKKEPPKTTTTNTQSARIATSEICVPPPENNILFYKADEQQELHLVFINFAEIDNRVRPLKVNDVSYDLMQEIADNSEIDLATQSTPLSGTSSSGIMKTMEEEPCAHEEENKIASDDTTLENPSEHSATSSVADVPDYVRSLEERIIALQQQVKDLSSKADKKGHDESSERYLAGAEEVIPRNLHSETIDQDFPMTWIFSDDLETRSSSSSSGYSSMSSSNLTNDSDSQGSLTSSSDSQNSMTSVSSQWDSFGSLESRSEWNVEVGLCPVS